MKNFFRRGDRLERELRSQRPEPRHEFLRALETRIDGGRYRAPARSLRLGLAGALTVAMLVALAAFGGLGYAATGVTHAVTAATHVVAPVHKAAPARKSAPVRQNQPLTSAQVQYLVTMCFHGHTIRVPSQAVNILRALGAKLGACGGGKTPPASQLVTMCYKGVTIQVKKTEVAGLVKLGAKKGACKK